MQRFRGLIVGALSVATIGVPFGLAQVTPSSSTTIADCAGSINIPIMSEGAPVDTCPGTVAPPVSSGGAPSQQTLTACSGIPGCLSNALYGPGNVVVPRPDTTVHQSQ
ncbi:MAG TPA: hypothetical protein VFB19_02435 [Mycobacterium sp.]|nr:hypothetical protein [Mycobacterium sp.]